MTFNRGLIADPEAFARDADAASWLFLYGHEKRFQGEVIGIPSASLFGVPEAAPA